MPQCHLMLQWRLCRPWEGRRCPTMQSSLRAGFPVASSSVTVFLWQATVIGSSSGPAWCLTEQQSEQLSFRQISLGETMATVSWLNSNWAAELPQAWCSLTGARYTQVDSCLWQSTELGCSFPSVHPSAPKSTSEKSHSIKLSLLSCWE